MAKRYSVTRARAELPAIIDATFKWTMRRSPRTQSAVIVTYTLTSVHFPAESVIVEADKVFKDPTYNYGPFSIP